VDKQTSSVNSKGPLFIVRALYTTVLLAIISLICSVLSIIFGIFSKKTGQIFGRLWAQLWLFTSGIKLVTKGTENLDTSKRYVFACNHQSAIDIPALYAALPVQISFISKKSLFFIPLVGWGMAAVGHVWISRSNAREARNSIMRAVDRVEKDNFSLVVFPEGTRSATGEMAEFKRGSFTLALRSKADLVPVAIHGTRQVMAKKSLFTMPGTVTISIGKPIKIVGEKDISKPALAEETKKQIEAMLKEM